MNAKGSVSVALASFNGQTYISEQIQSILAQSAPVTQIVIADDGSSDATLDTARAALGAFDGEVVLLPPGQEPLGVTRNFQRALAACTGEFIALADQDDLWHPDKIERMRVALGDGLLAFSDARLVDASGAPVPERTTLFQGLGMSEWELERLHSGDTWPVFLRRNLVTGATALLRRSLLSLAGEFPNGWVHDEWLAIVAAAHGGVRLCDEPTIDYRQHGSNQIGMRSRLTWQIRFARLRAPRSERNARLLARAAALAQWTATHAPELHDDAAAKLAHEQVRSAYPARRLARIGPIVRERATGRYEQFGLGSSDVVRDLVQPV